jgi:hypothetical protein
MRDLFSTAAPVRRDQGMSDAQRRATKAANVPLFGAAPSPLRTMVAKAEQLAADVERETRARITARPTEPTLEQRRSRLPRHLAAKTEGGGLSIGAAELLSLVLSVYAACREPVVLTPSGVAEHMKVDLHEASRRIAELGEKSLLLPVVDYLGRRGWRPDPGLIG